MKGQRRSAELRGDPPLIPSSHNFAREESTRSAGRLHFIQVPANNPPAAGAGLVCELLQLPHRPSAELPYFLFCALTFERFEVS